MCVCVCAASHADHLTSLLNVWLSLHVAGLPTDGSVRLLFADKFMHRKTESEPREMWLGTFTEAWYPFTRHPILDRRQLGPSQNVRGKKVCLDRAVLTVPPRASYFYPTHGVGCSPSDLTTSCVGWILRNMSLAELAPPPASQGGTVVVTFVTRGGPRVSTRLLRNEDELLKALSERFRGDELDIRRVDFDGA
jgi:hypothetical protein